MNGRYLIDSPDYCAGRLLSDQNPDHRVLEAGNRGELMCKLLFSYYPLDFQAKIDL